MCFNPNLRERQIKKWLRMSQMEFNSGAFPEPFNNHSRVYKWASHFKKKRLPFSQKLNYFPSEWKTSYSSQLMYM